MCNRFGLVWTRPMISCHIGPFSHTYTFNFGLFFISKTVKNWARYDKIHFYCAISTILVNIGRFNLFLSQMLTILGDLRLNLEGKIRRIKSPIQFNRDQLRPVPKLIKTNYDRFFSVSVRFLGLYHKRKPVAVAVAYKKAKNQTRPVF